jgi:hypothetical protein
MDPYELPNNITFDDLKPLCSTTLKKQAKNIRVYKSEKKISTTKMKDKICVDFDPSSLYTHILN